MQKINPKNAIKTLISIPFLLLIYLLQATVFSRFLIFGAKPLLLPLAVVAASLFGGSIKGGVCGIFAGILCDLSFNQPTIEFTLILTFIGIIVGLLSETVIVKGFPSYLATSLGVLIICAVIQIFPFFFFRGVSPGILLTTALRQTLASLIFTIPIYCIVRYVDRAF